VKPLGRKYSISANADPQVVEEAYGLVSWRGVVLIKECFAYDTATGEHYGAPLEQYTLQTVDLYDSWESAAEAALELGETWVEKSQEKKKSLTTERFSYK
jgi:hypothetical protein